MRLRRPWVGLGLGFGLAIFGAPAPAPLVAQTSTEASIDVGGQSRTYLLHVPPGRSQPGALPPVLLVLHGGGGNATQMEKMTGLDALADLKGFVVVYPNGTGPLQRERLLTWNAGNCCGWALDHRVDDVAFLRAIVARLTKEQKADPQRIFATGFSNGAGMAYRAACEMPDVLAGVAPVSGAVSVDCAPREPISVIAFNGTADQHVPYEGGKPTRQLDRKHPRTDRSVASEIEQWRRLDGCPSEAKHSVHGSIARDSYGPCRAGTAVELVTIRGSGHEWPGGERWAPWADPTTSEISANAAMWDFFAAHPKAPAP